MNTVEILIRIENMPLGEYASSLKLPKKKEKTHLRWLRKSSFVEQKNSTPTRGIFRHLMIWYRRGAWNYQWPLSKWAAALQELLSASDEAKGEDPGEEKGL